MLPDTTRSVLWSAATEVTQFSFCILENSANVVSVICGDKSLDISLWISSGSTSSSDTETKSSLCTELAVSFWPKCAFGRVTKGFFFNVPHSAIDLKSN